MKILLVVFVLFIKFVNADVINIDNRELSNLIEKEMISYCKNLIYKKIKKDVQIFTCTPY